MKYIMVEQQPATIDGYIDLKDPVSEFNGVYDNAPIYVDEDFLEFEHTDGLNYINVEISRVDNLGDYFKWNSKKIQLNLLESFGAGVLYPKTNSTLLSKEKNDEFHLAGFGLSFKTGINLTLFDHFFVQAEFKTGYIDMSDIRTTRSTREVFGTFGMLQPQDVLSVRYSYGGDIGLLRAETTQGFQLSPEVIFLIQQLGGTNMATASTTMSTEELSSYLLNQNSRNSKKKAVFIISTSVKITSF